MISFANPNRWTGSKHAYHGPFKQHRQCPGQNYCSIYLGIPLQLKDFFAQVQAKSQASQKIIRNSRHASIMGAIWPGVRWQHDTSGPLSGVSAIWQKNGVYRSMEGIISNLAGSRFQCVIYVFSYYY